MLSRKDRMDEGVELPEAWRKEVGDLLKRIYKKQCVDGHTFEVMGRLYADELCLVASFFNQQRPQIIPVTYHASVDMTDAKDQKKSLGILVDSIGIFFDTVFADKEWSDYNPFWEQVEFKGLSFYTMSTRENIILSLAADKLLKDAKS